MATSGYGSAERETEEVRVELNELDGSSTQSIRVCAGVAFAAGIEHESVAEFELTAALDAAEGAASVPIGLVIGSTEHTASGRLSSEGSSLTLRVPVPADEVDRWGECSPWAEVRVGPNEGDSRGAAVVWSLRVRAEVHISGGGWPWTDNLPMTLEVSP